MKALLFYFLGALVMYLAVSSILLITIFAGIWIRLKIEKNPVLEEGKVFRPFSGILGGWFGQMDHFITQKVYLKLNESLLKRFLIFYAPVYHFLYHTLMFRAAILLLIITISGLILSSIW